MFNESEKLLSSNFKTYKNSEIPSEEISLMRGIDYNPKPMIQKELNKRSNTKLDSVSINVISNANSEQKYRDLIDQQKMSIE